MIDLMPILPRLLPKAVDWAERQQAVILSTGIPLTQEQAEIASAVGVDQPEKIRIKVVEKLPLPEDPELAEVARQTGLLGPNITGLTLFYGIFICRRDDGNRNLIAHECRHVYQYEQYRSMSEFLQEYLRQIITVGYLKAPLEQDACKAAAIYT